MTVRKKLFIAMLVLACTLLSALTAGADAVWEIQHIAEDNEIKAGRLETIVVESEIIETDYQAPVASLFGEEQQSTDTDRYGRSVLAAKENATQLLYAYDALVSGIANLDLRIPVYCGSGSLTNNDFEMAYEAYTSDHPEVFWLGLYHMKSVDAAQNIVYFYPGYTLYGEHVIHSGVEASLRNSLVNSGINISLNEISYESFKADILKKNEKFQKRLDSIIEKMYKAVPERESVYETQYHRALWLHDKVCYTVEYIFGPNHQTSYGALMDRKAVCAGYTKLYNCLLLKAGIEAWSVEGKSYDAKKKEFINHEWTLMWLDGNCVYTDVTWDDNGHDNYHLYFAREIEEFSANYSHVPSAFFYTDSLPVGDCDKCRGHGYFDHEKTDNKVEGDITAEKIGSLLEQKVENRVWEAVILDPTGKDVINWLSENLGSLIGKYLPNGSWNFSFISKGNSVTGLELHFIAVANKQNENIVTCQKDEDNSSYVVDVVMEDNDRDASFLIVFYNENGQITDTQLYNTSFAFKEFEVVMPETSAYFKTFLLNNSSLMPLCESLKSSD